jgi:hypothetical protein
LRIDLACIEGLAQVDVDVADLVFLERGSDVLGSRSRSRLGKDANPNGDRTDNCLDRFFILALFFILSASPS